MSEIVEITLHTSKPEKWRFVDLETGSVWRWDVDKNRFQRLWDTRVDLVPTPGGGHDD